MIEKGMPTEQAILAGATQKEFQWALERFRRLWDEISLIGLRSDGGYDRSSWTLTYQELNDWFITQAHARGMRVEEDGNGNLWAWLGEHHGGLAFATGSHLDSVSGGGGYDGPLGIAAAFIALDVLEIRGTLPSRPIVIVGFIEEEGGRFGVPCLGSRLATGKIRPSSVLDLRDRSGIALKEVVACGGKDSYTLAPTPEILSRIGLFCELHIEQGVALAPLGQPVGVAEFIWPHARWRLTFDGEGNHAGTTRMADRHDPMIALAETILAAKEEAEGIGIATIGRIEATPNATNAICSSVTAWLDARAPSDFILDALWSGVLARSQAAAKALGIKFIFNVESRSPEVRFDKTFNSNLISTGHDLGLQIPLLSTAAGHDAAVLADVIPSTMIFIRNESGVSHSPKEIAEDADCVIGAILLAKIISESEMPNPGNQTRERPNE
jgi:N-carbamoyl-L-amino-acid hydrolase